MHSLCFTPTQILHSLQKDNPKSALIPRDIYNLFASLRIEELDSQTPIEWLLQVISKSIVIHKNTNESLQKLKDLQFNPREYIHPDTNKLQTLFLAHPEAIKLWKNHPDIILLDSTYKTNQFRMPLLNICAITGNKKVVQIGLCFLSGEKKPDYEQAIRWVRELMEKKEIESQFALLLTKNSL